jgi:hypothetical protein
MFDEEIEIWDWTHLYPDWVQWRVIVLTLIKQFIS